MDSLPPPPPAEVSPVVAPGDIYPRSGREQELCERASHPDWFYLGGLLALDVGAAAYDSSTFVGTSSSIAVRFTGPVALGLVWGATLGGGWLALPKCDPHWVGEPPREGDVRAQWPLALSLALLAGATAPIFNGIASQAQPQNYPTIELSMRVVAAGVAGFGGALLPFLLPPRTWSAARELENIRVGADGRGGLSLGYTTTF